MIRLLRLNVLTQVSNQGDKEEQKTVNELNNCPSHDIKLAPSPSYDPKLAQDLSKSLNCLYPGVWVWLNCVDGVMASPGVVKSVSGKMITLRGADRTHHTYSLYITAYPSNLRLARQGF